MEPWSLRRALNWSVYTAIVLAAHTHGNDTYSQTGVSYRVLLKDYEVNLCEISLPLHSSHTN